MEDDPIKSDYAFSIDAESFYEVPLGPVEPRRRIPDVPRDIDDRDFLMEHLNDPNFDLNKRASSIETGESESFELAMRKGPIFSDTESHTTATTAVTDTTTAIAEAIVPDGPPEDDSPYPEVRGSVSSVDNPEMPVNTFRMWFLGLFYTILISFLNQIFSMRYPSLAITGMVAQLTALPLGKAMEYILPTDTFRVFGYTCSLNPGPFNIKEHVCITIMANVVAGGAYATDIIATQRVFYGQQFGYAYQILLVLSTQLLGFSFGGILRRFVVWPSSMIWPGALVNSSLFNALHKTYGKRDGRHMTRERFFCIAVACSFAWFFVPGYLFTGLSMFNWACWIAPSNPVVNGLFGTNTGLGMSILTFDWSMIAFIGSPMVTPWWSTMNTMASFVIHFWWITPAIYFTNTWFSKFMPISTDYVYDHFGLPYEATNVLTEGVFDGDLYSAYSPAFLPASLTIAYGTAFASFTAVIVHTWIWHGNSIARRFRSSLKSESQKDVHARLMLAYEEVPWYWYTAVGVISTIFLFVAISVYPTQLPIWAALLAFALAALLTIPLAMLQAMTNQQIALQVMHEMICGYILPGRPIANMIFKCIAYIGTNQATGFAGDLKLGHYMKIPPRTTFSIQAVAAIVSAFVVTSTQNWMFDNIEDMCTPDQKHGFVCPSTTTFATASVLWGAIGPARLFGPGAPYNALLWFFAAGAILPIPFFFLSKRYPHGMWRYINIPVFFAGVGTMPPATGMNYASWGVVGFIFQYFMRRFHLRWWMRHNYLLSAALDGGVALGLVVIFFCLQLPKGGIELNWWGNTVWTNTSDALGLPAIVLGADESFGPLTWA